MITWVNDFRGFIAKRLDCTDFKATAFTALQCIQLSLRSNEPMDKFDPHLF